MTAEELKTALQAYYDDQANIGVCMYALMKDASNPGPFKLDIEAESEHGLKDLFMQSMRDEIFSKDELSCLICLARTNESMPSMFTISIFRKS